ncbi:MAG: histidinol-phosphatase HisJ family protein [Desulfitobacteriaceae bacterium]
MLDLHVHLIGHQDRRADSAAIRDFLTMARAQGLKEIGFADHDLYLDELNLPLIREVAGEFPDLRVRVGLEVDYRPGEEHKLRDSLGTFPFDYVLGSVHEIARWAFDAPGQENHHREQDPDGLYRHYFSLVAQAARSGFFTTLAHFDLVKIYGVRPKTDILELADEALTSTFTAGCAIEVNTNGRYKPVREFYPEERLLQEIARRGIPITLGSDAHEAKIVGRDLPEVVKTLQSMGVRSVVGFEQRKQVIYPI